MEHSKYPSVMTPPNLAEISWRGNRFTIPYHFVVLSRIVRSVIEDCADKASDIDSKRAGEPVTEFLN
jgi:hypothetical protein